MNDLMHAYFPTQFPTLKLILTFLFHHRSESSNEAEKMSLNSSFSGPTSLPLAKSDAGDSSVPHSPRSFHKIPPDGASLQSHNSETGHGEMSLDCRREAEGSSANNSPPTSVIQGIGDSEDSQVGCDTDFFRNRKVDQKLCLVGNLYQLSTTLGPDPVSSGPS